VVLWFLRFTKVEKVEHIGHGSLDWQEGKKDEYKIESKVLLGEIS
jgi:hypothetical protein